MQAGNDAALMGASRRAIEDATREDVESRTDRHQEAIREAMRERIGGRLNG